MYTYIYNIRLNKYEKYIHIYINVYIYMYKHMPIYIYILCIYLHILEHKKITIHTYICIHVCIYIGARGISYRNVVSMCHHHAHLYLHAK